MHRSPRALPGFFGWQVVGAAFVVALFGWGVGFYGPPVFLHAVQARTGWPVALVSAAVTSHFLVGAAVVANLARLHRRFGLVAVTRAGAVAAALGVLGWALADSPWQLFLATLLSGFGWASTSAAAINAIVAPWFIRRRPAALASAYNGASIGGVLLSPLWVLLIATLGFPMAAALLGAAMVGVLWWVAGRWLGGSPAAMGLAPDGGPAAPASPPPAPATPPGWRDRVFATLALGSALALFAQIGLIAHLFSLLVPALGGQGAGLAMGLATACAILGRTVTGWMIGPGAERRRVAALGYGVQLLGSLVLWSAGGAEPALLLAGVVLFGLGLGNATSMPPLIAQQDFPEAQVARVVALVTASGQAAYAFAPAAFGLLRDAAGGAPMLYLVAAALQAAAAGVVLAGGRRPVA